MTSKLRYLLATLLLVPLVTLLSAAPAQAYDGDPWMNIATNRCLDDNVFIGLSAATCKNYESTDQSWRKSGFGDGTYRMQNVRTGLCMGVDSHGLRTYTCAKAGTSAAKYQSWRFTRMTSIGAARLQNKWTGKCLDDSLEIGHLNLATCVSPSNHSADHEAWVIHLV